MPQPLPLPKIGEFLLLIMEAEEEAEDAAVDVAVEEGGVAGATTWRTQHNHPRIIILEGEVVFHP